MKIKWRVLIQVIVLLVLASAAREGMAQTAKQAKTRTAFVFPNPEVSVPGGPPKSSEESYERAKRFMASYMRAFIDEFLQMNGLRENLFNEKEILHQAYARIEATPLRDLSNPDSIRNGIVEFRTDLMAIADRLYRKDMPNPKYFAGGGRVDSLERKVNDLLMVSKQYADLVKQVEELKQRLNRLQQKQSDVQVAAPAPVNSGQMRLTYAALLLAAGAFIVQIISSRR